MPVTASEFRSRFGTFVEVPLDAADPASETIKCRRPEMYDQVFHGLLPMPLYHAMVKAIAGAVRDGEGEMDLVAFATAGSPETAEFVDRWVCLAAVAPRIVRTFAEAGTDALWVEEVPMALRSRIFAATFRLADAQQTGGREAAETFRGGAAGAPPGPAGAAVPHAAVELVGSAGQRTRVGP